MATKLDKPLKREIHIDGKPFIVTLEPNGFRLVGKGRRKGLEISWDDLVSGEAAMATALRASIDPKVNLAPSAREVRGRGRGRRATAARG